MARLGYERWVAQGGDWGAGVTHALAHQRPQGLIAAHVNWQFVFPEKLPENPTPAERKAIDRAALFANDQSGYFREQGTRPQTIGYPLADSAAGQALWIYEKFQSWTDNHGNPEDELSVDAMLDDISLYWFTGAGASAAQFIYDASHAGDWVPSSLAKQGWAVFGGAGTVIRRLMDPERQMAHWSAFERGGHFAAMEAPDLLVEDVRGYFRQLR
jgi:pimeloyl-ACP methyl ester carboxylesterase